MTESSLSRLLKARSESGRCRVICYSPVHNLTLGQLPFETLVLPRTHVAALSRQTRVMADGLELPTQRPCPMSSHKIGDD